MSNAPWTAAVREIRAKRNLSMRGMARLVGVSANFISLMENDREKVPGDFPQRVALALNLSEKERDKLIRAGERANKTIKFDGLKQLSLGLVQQLAHSDGKLSPDDQVIVASIANALPTMSDDDREALANVLRKYPHSHVPVEALERSRRNRNTAAATTTKSQRNGRYGFRVPELTEKRIWFSTDKLRRDSNLTDALCLDILDFIENKMSNCIDGLRLVIDDSVLLPFQEAVMVPTDNIIVVRSTVYDDAADGKVRARFTLAHELGHAVLHKDVQLNNWSDEWPDNCNSEIQADQFAASLLLPPRHVAKFSTPEEAARICGVSRESAQISLNRYRRMPHWIPGRYPFDGS